jgi:acyl-CoA thioester hydrolase
MTYTEVQIRVRYGETDRMGYVYYGNYAQYFEVARVEALRTFGISYREMEEEGIMLPVHTYNVQFIKPAYYDDLLTIRTHILRMAGTRIFFGFETFNEKGDKINTAEVSLVFLHAATKKPCAPPEYLIQRIPN